MRQWWRWLVLLLLLVGLFPNPSAAQSDILITAFCEENFSVFVITYNHLPVNSLVEYQILRDVDSSEFTRGSFTNTLTDHFYSNSEVGGVGGYQVIVSIPEHGFTQTFNTFCTQHWDVQGGRVDAFCEASFDEFVITYSNMPIGLTFDYTVRNSVGAVIHTGSFTNTLTSSFTGAGDGYPGANTVEIQLSTGESHILTEVYCPDSAPTGAEHANSHACRDNPGKANGHRPEDIPPCTGD